MKQLKNLEELTEGNKLKTDKELGPSLGPHTDSAALVDLSHMLKQVPGKVETVVAQA